MERPRGLIGTFDESVVMEDVSNGDDDPAGASAMSRARPRSPLAKTRSLSDSGGTPSKLSPSPHIVEASRRTSKDDSHIGELQQPVTPRPDVSRRGLSLQMPPRDFTPPPPAAAASSSAYVKPAPLSPKLDHSQIYASPTNILPRRSRGLDFSRAATSLHHSTLAEQSSPDSSPTIGGRRAMSIPGRRGDYGGPEQTSSSLWSMMGSQEKMNISSSLGSTHAVMSDSASSSDDDDLMEEDTDEPYITTPQISKTTSIGPFGSPAMSSLASFQHRQRPRRQAKKKMRGPLGLGFSSSTSASLSRSPPHNSGSHARAESISWQANQLRISGADSEESARALNDMDGMNGDGQRSVIRRVVTRRGNLLPKSKNFARIRAALAEEGAPAEAESAREAEVVKQVREGEPELDLRIPPSSHEGLEPCTALSSPNLAATQDILDDIPETDIMGDVSMALSSSFKQQVIRNSKGKSFWDTFSESSSIGTRTTPPPPAFLPRGSSSGVSEDVAMDSPSLYGLSGIIMQPSHSRAESQRSDTPHTGSQAGPLPPSAAEITRRINSKRRRGDDEFDPVSFKRRAVSPGMSVQNSPVTQSPMQRDLAPWGSRPGSNGGDKGTSSAPSESGSMGGGASGTVSGSSGSRVANNKPRVGFQGMVDTNDGIMRMSIE